LAKTLEPRSPPRLRGEADPDRLGEDLVRMASETLQPWHVTFCRGPITTLNPSRKVAIPRTLLVV
jgi:hypothetical protein